MKARKKASGKPVRKRAVSAKGPEEHYLRVKFGLLKDNRPEIYAFFYSYLPKILQKLGEKKAGLKIERLEPLDEKHVNLPYHSRDKIMHALAKFTLAHSLHRQHNILIAALPVARLARTLEDYNILFDLFFTDVEVHCKDFKVEMMDGFYNTLLLVGKKPALEKIKSLLEAMLEKKAEFKWVDHSRKQGG